MDCEESRNLISAQVDGEIAAPQRMALEAHLAVCADCRAVLEAFRLQDSRLRRAFAPRRRAARDLAARVAADLEPPARGTVLRRVFLAAAAAAAGFAAAVLVFRPWEAPEAPPVAAQPAPRLVPLPAAASAESIARLAVASGVIEMLAGGDWRPLPSGGSIEPGTRIRTGPEALCELQTSDGSEVRMSTSTEAAFQTNRRIDLTRGRLWSSVQRHEVPFEVSVPQATVTALGTKFDLECLPEATELRVLEGTTRVLGRGGERLVRSGEKATITPEAVKDVRAADVLFATNWVNRILVLKGPEHPELESRLLDLLAYIGEGKTQFLAEAEIRQLGPSCVKPLLSYVESQRSRMDRNGRLKAARIACEVATRSSAHDLIELLADESREVRAWAAEALARITGETQGTAPGSWLEQPFSENEAAFKKWLSWWEAHRREYAETPEKLGGSEKRTGAPEGPQKTK